MLFFQCFHTVCWVMEGICPLKYLSQQLPQFLPHAGTWSEVLSQVGTWPNLEYLWKSSLVKQKLKVS